MDIDELLNLVFNDGNTIDVKSLFENKLEEYDLSKTKALKLLGIDKDVFEEILNGTAKQPNLINVVKIAQFLEIGIDKFIPIVLKNQSSENILLIENARKSSFLIKHFDIKMLTKQGFFGVKDDIQALVSKVLTFFELDSIYEYQRKLNEPLYSRTKKVFSDKMKDFWILSAYQTFKTINNPNEYDRVRLKDLIGKIKPYCQDVNNGLLIVCKALYNIGVTVIFQDYLSTTQVRGGTFILNGKPCIVMTDFNKKYPTLWFTLLHEIHHVLFDFETIELNNYHLTGEDDLFLIEEKANSFAREFFLSEEKFNFVKRFIDNPYLVSRFSKENEIHVSVTYSFFTWYQNSLYGKNYHAAFKEFYPLSSVSVAKLNPITWTDANLKTSATKIKATLELK